MDPILESAFLNIKLEKPLHRLNMHVKLNFLLLQRAPLLLESQPFPFGISVMAVHKLSDGLKRIMLQCRFSQGAHPVTSMDTAR